MDWKLLLIICVMSLSLIDLVVTYVYVSTYKKWQPDKPFNLIELNPLLVFLWNKMGLTIGMITGGVVILSLNYIITKETHWIFGVIILIFLVLALFNHAKNINLLYMLMEKYPSGYLNPEIFGEVIGNVK